MLVLATGCGGGSGQSAPGPSATTTPTASPTTTPTASSPPTRAAAFPAYSATATVRSVQVHTSPAGPVARTLADPQPSGAPLVFLVVEQRSDWIRVQLPVRPNGSTGWVRAVDVTLAGLAYRIDVRLKAHRLDLVKLGKVERSYPIGVGTGDTPTPGGTFYLKELLQPPNPRGPYGPYAYGLSGFSNVLSSFAGGDGVIGIHGTDSPALVGKDVSHGCIRMLNPDITALTGKLALGTPVRILA